MIILRLINAILFILLAVMYGREAANSYASISQRKFFLACAIFLGACAIFQIIFAFF